MWLLRGRRWEQLGTRDTLTREGGQAEAVFRAGRRACLRTLICGVWGGVEPMRAKLRRSTKLRMGRGQIRVGEREGLSTAEVDVYQLA